MKINAILTKPLDGCAVGAPRAFDAADFKRLRAMGAVREAGQDDETEAATEEATALLERLRHPAEGPKLLAEMKSSFEAASREREALRVEIEDGRKAVNDAISARDAAIVERDEMQTARDSARADLEGAHRDLEVLRAQIDAKPTETASRRKP